MRERKEEALTSLNLLSSLRDVGWLVGSMFMGSLSTSANRELHANHTKERRVCGKGGVLAQIWSMVAIPIALFLSFFFSFLTEKVMDG